MCGVAGVVSSRPVNGGIVVEMRDRLIHRGPDHGGLWRSDDQRVCLGHRRLVIVDPSPASNQPFVSADGNLVIVFNGEIYNFRDVRRELEREGVSFRTRSDTEVLIEAYAAWGVKCLDRLSGMFAFAIWDRAEETLICARDRAGEKPFYYASVGGSFIFASELKSLLAWPGFPRNLDYTAVADFLTLGFVPDPKSIWSAASKLPPGNWLEVELGAGSPRVNGPFEYWDMSFEPDRTVADWGPAIRDTLEHAASEMSYADVPVGTFLSGGVDSSAVTAALTNAGSRVRTFTIGFEEEGYDERPWARQVATQYATEHTDRIVTADEAEAVFRDTILWHFDEPLADHSYLPTYYVCREARNHIVVALTGDGGDELFAGYGKYHRMALRQSVDWAFSRSSVRRVAAGAGAVARRQSRSGSRLQAYGSPPARLVLEMLVLGLKPAELRQQARGPLADVLAHYDPLDAVRPLLAKAPPEEVGFVNSMRYLDLKLYLGAGVLVKVDRASMAVSLETRPVFLHRDMLSLAGRIPAEHLVDRTTTKKALKSALVPWLPESVLTRQKMGFGAPVGEWLRGGLSDRLGGSTTRAGELLDPAFLARTSADHAARRGEVTATLHNAIFLEHWLEKWVSG
jgi:asparagine synthase (glutamine-hydrolysing)